MLGGQQQLVFFESCSRRGGRRNLDLDISEFCAPVGTIIVIDFILLRRPNSLVTQLSIEHIAITRNKKQQGDHMGTNWLRFSFEARPYSHFSSWRGQEGGGRGEGGKGGSVPKWRAAQLLFLGNSALLVCAVVTDVF